MKHLAATATRQSSASPEAAYALLTDIDGYPRWYPTGVPSARTVNRDANGTPTEAQAQLAVAVGPLNRQFDVRMAVVTEALRRVELSRIPHDSRDKERLAVRWRLSPGSGGNGTTIAVELDADLSVPPFLPVGSVSETIAAGFADAAVRALAG
jgi:ribosome-associated toxin RatA of RatAB toxin-antitoxin module